MADPDFSVILGGVGRGDADAAQQLLPLVYSQLRAAAQNAMNGERPDHTLQATALVHEAFAKLVGGKPVDWANRAHFYEAAARAMRQILIDHARARNTAKRGGRDGKVPLTDFAAALEASTDEIMALDSALTRLETHDTELAGVVRLRFFAGLSGEDAASALGVSARKVDMLWSRARAWLFRELTRSEE
ncbi:MAG: sigma-70 family RNA polymerase sigma factor [Phycisphaerae bacterium]|nr:sigma-70 family RNA polymerase sigma factor [Phycisphaerae bacterium]